MATRSGGSGVLYALILFVFLFIFALALAILFYTQRMTVEEQVAQYARLSDEFVSETQQRSDAFQADLNERGQTTVYGYLDSQIDALKRKLVGNEGMGMEQLNREIERVGIADGESAISEINQLKSQITSLEEQVASKQQAIEEADRNIDQLESKLTTLQESTKSQVADLRKQLEDRTTQWQQFEEASKAERAEVVERLEQARENAQARIREKDAEIRTLNNEIDRLNGRVANLSRIIKESRLSAPDMTLEADGRIVDVDPRENIVYINLGKDDHLILGMTFEVFDATTGIQTEVERAGQLVHTGGKATIEVIRFSETGATAVCRIVRQAYGRPVVTGDLISNIIYDRDRTFRFFVYGDFDLNNDGLATPIERQRVVNMIREWGGEVIDADEMPVDTDFLVIGQNIEFPTAPPDDPLPTPEQVERYQTDLARYKRYEELAGLARELSIPVLNQNRFLTLVGQAGH